MSYRLTAYFFIFFLFLTALLGGYATLGLSSLDMTGLTLTSWINGKAAAQAEEKIEESLPYKDQATNLWGSLRFGLFRTGAPGVIIGKDGWLFTKEEFETSAHFDSNTASNLNQIYQKISTLESYGIKTLMVWIPAKARIHHSQLPSHTRPAAHQMIIPPQGIELLDGNAVLSPIKNRAFMRTDTHWSQTATEQMADAVATAVKKYFPELILTNKAFNTTITDTKILYNGDLMRYVPADYLPSALRIPAEQIAHYQTESVSDELQDLFSEEMIDVVLIGTSYSAQKEWHFAGFLKQALQADILNLSDEGKGPFAPMHTFIQQLESGEISPPKLVIWEFPERYLPRRIDKTEREGS